jgi:hypothetical protein
MPAHKLMRFAVTEAPNDKALAHDKSQQRPKETDKNQRLATALRRNLAKRKNRKSTGLADADK